MKNLILILVLAVAPFNTFVPATPPMKRRMNEILKMSKIKKSSLVARQDQCPFECPDGGCCPEGLNCISPNKCDVPCFIDDESYNDGTCCSEGTICTFDSF